MDVAQEDIVAILILPRYLGAEFLEDIQLREKGGAIVHVPTVFTTPAEGLSLRDLEPRGSQWCLAG